MAGHRRLHLAVAVTAAAVALTGCSQGSATQNTENADGSTTIRYFTFSAAPDHEADLDRVVKAFEKENPDIDVRVETAPYDSYFTKLQTAVAGGTAPDTFELNYENFVTYADSGALAELEGVDEAPFAPKLLEAFQYDGKQYGLPESFSNVVLFYNKDLFAKAGVEEPTADWTWAEEAAAAKKLTDKKSGVFGDYQPVSFHEFYKALAQAGGSFLNEDKSAAAFNSPEGVKAAEWLVEKMGTTMPTEADGVGTPDYDSGLFKSGKLAMWHTGIWMFSAMADAPFEWDIVVEPGDVQKASAMFTNGVAVSSATKNTDAAQAWVEYLTGSEESTTMRVETSWELPPTQDESVLAPYLEQTPPANREAVFEALDAPVLPPVIKSQQEMQDAVGQQLSEAAAGRKSVKQALADAEKQVNELLG
jgi:multiple sugar transport system substrate-binding protein